MSGYSLVLHTSARCSAGPEHAAVMLKVVDCRHVAVQYHCSWLKGGGDSRVRWGYPIQGALVREVVFDIVVLGDISFGIYCQQRYWSGHSQRSGFTRS